VFSPCCDKRPARAPGAWRARGWSSASRNCEAPGGSGDLDGEDARLLASSSSIAPLICNPAAHGSPTALQQPQLWASFIEGRTITSLSYLRPCWERRPPKPCQVWLLLLLLLLRLPRVCLHQEVEMQRVLTAVKTAAERWARSGRWDGHAILGTHLPAAFLTHAGFRPRRPRVCCCCWGAVSTPACPGLEPHIAVLLSRESGLAKQQASLLQYRVPTGQENWRRLSVPPSQQPSTVLSLKARRGAGTRTLTTTHAYGLMNRASAGGDHTRSTP
jgi:hypothetical protein